MPALSRSLLLVTQAFPPASGSGVQRGAKLVKYLLRGGWRVHVIALDPTAWPDHDPSMVPEVAGALVTTVRLSRVPGISHPAARAIPGIRRAMRNALADPERRPDVALLTAPDVHWAVAARELAAAGVPFVADYPDPWTVLPSDFRVSTPTKMRSRLKWALAPHLEGWVLDRSAGATFADEPVRAEYAARFPRVAGRVIHNGFDPEDFAGASSPERISPRARIRLTHVGSFAGHQRSPLAPARVLRRAVERAGMDPSAVELWLVGAGAEPFREDVRAELGGIAFEMTGWVSHAEAIAHMRAADVLWLQTVLRLRFVSTGKIYEYLAAGRPIVGLAHPLAPATDLVARAGAGRLASTEEAAADALADVLRAGAAPVEVAPALLQPFDREVLAGRMAEVLDEAIG